MMSDVDLGRVLSHWPADGYDMQDIAFLAGLGERVARGRLTRPEEVRDEIVRHASPGIARLVARDLSRSPRARALVIRAYLTSPDPIKEYREVAAYDYTEALSRAFPDEFTAGPVWEEIEEPDEGPLGFLGRRKRRFKVSKKMRKRIKKVGKFVAIGAAVAGAVALTIATAGAAAPALASAAGSAFQMQQAKKKAKAEKKAIGQAEAELAALQQPMSPPDPGQIAPTTQAAFQVTAEQQQAFAQQPPLHGAPAAAQYAGQAGAVQAQGYLVGQVAPQAMASYAAQEVAGKTPEQISAETGLSVEEINRTRVEEAEKVAAGAEPSKETPGWVAPAAVAGGGLILALATGILGADEWPWETPAVAAWN